MANPLQDQLLKAGLVKPHQIKKATKEKRQAQRGNTPDAATEQARLAQQHKAQRAQVISGVLAVVRFDQTYELVPSVTAEKIARRDPAVDRQHQGSPVSLHLLSGSAMAAALGLAELRGHRRPGGPQLNARRV